MRTTHNHALNDVWVPPGGDRPWIVGEGGCALRPASDGGWEPLTTCSIELKDVDLRRVPMAISDDARFERRDGGWGRVASLPVADVRRFAPLGDGGFVYLAARDLYVNQARRNLTFGEGLELAVADDQRIVFLTSDGELLETSVTGGGKITLDAGLRSGGRPNVQSLVVDDRGTIWAADVAGVVLRSSGPGTWVPEATGLTADVDDVAVSGDRVWAITNDTLATRDPDGGWRTTPLPWDSAYRVAALPGDEAIVFRQYVPGVRLNASFTESRDVEVPPQGLSGRLVTRGGELWGLGYKGALMRFRLDQ